MALTLLLSALRLVAGQLEWSCQWTDAPFTDAPPSAFDSSLGALIQLIGAGENGTPDLAIPQGDGVSGDDFVLAMRWLGAGMLRSNEGNLFECGDSVLAEKGAGLFVRVWSASSPSFERGQVPLSGTILHMDSMVRVFPGGGDAPSLPLRMVFDVQMSAATTYPTEDSDHDGLPDWWEMKYFQDSSRAVADSDPDGDGMSNLAEAVAGSDPRSAMSVLRLEQAHIGPAGMEIQWRSEEGRQYTLSSSATLHGEYRRISQGVVATPPLNHWTNELGDAASGMYRVEVQP